MRKVQLIGARFHVIVLSEIWIVDELERIEIPSFSAHHSVHTRTSSNGVTVLVDLDLGKLNANLLVYN